MYRLLSLSESRACNHQRSAPVYRVVCSLPSRAEYRTPSSRDLGDLLHTAAATPGSSQKSSAFPRESSALALPSAGRARRPYNYQHYSGQTTAHTMVKTTTSKAVSTQQPRKQQRAPGKGGLAGTPLFAACALIISRLTSSKERLVLSKASPLTNRGTTARPAAVR